jgi:hypothetical protein
MSYFTALHHARPFRIALLLWLIPAAVSLIYAMPVQGAGCEISNLMVTVSDCDADGKFTMTIDFDVVQPGNNGFKVWNSAYYGEFDYTDLPVTVGPFVGDCKTSWDINVKDLSNPHCFAQANIGKVCCNGGDPGDCSIKDARVDIACDGDTIFYATIDFSVINGGASGFNLYVNGNQAGAYSYGDVPVTVGPLLADCKTAYTFAIKDIDDPGCHLSISKGKVCCPGGDPGDKCKIKDLVAVAGECDDDDLFYVELDFTVLHPGNSGFKVYGNGQDYGVFEYTDLPLLLGPLSGDCKTAWAFAVKDMDDPHCVASVNIGKKCCNGGEPTDCQFKEVSVAVDCDGDSVFYALLNFTALNPGSNGFSVYVHGQSLGQYDYASLPISLGPFHADCQTKYVFRIEDNEHEKCHQDFHLGKVCCDPQEKCQIKALQATAGPCTTDSTYLLTIDFNWVHADAGYFDVWVNGMAYGSYHTDDLPLTLEVLGGKTSKDMLKVCMQEPHGCCAHMHYHTPACLKHGFYVAQAFAPLDEVPAEETYLHRDPHQSISMRIDQRPFIFTPTRPWTEVKSVTMCSLSGQVVFHALTPGNVTGWIEIAMPSARQAGIYVVSILTDSGIASFRVFLPTD